MCFNNYFNYFVISEAKYEFLIFNVYPAPDPVPNSVTQLLLGEGLNLAYAL